jgi:hypothetical protein
MTKEHQHDSRTRTRPTDTRVNDKGQRLEENRKVKAKAKVEGKIKPSRKVKVEAEVKGWRNEDGGWRQYVLRSR